jgi:hypothetical protein
MVKKVESETALDRVIDETPESKTFLCSKYPTLTVLIKRLGGTNVADKIAKFANGSLVTDDEETIAKLRSIPNVVEWKGNWYECAFCDFKTRFPNGFKKHLNDSHPEAG